MIPGWRDHVLSRVNNLGIEDTYLPAAEIDEGTVSIHRHDFGLVCVSPADRNWRMNSCADCRFVLFGKFQLLVRKFFESGNDMAGRRLKTVIAKLQIKLGDLEGFFLGVRLGSDFAQK